MEIDLVDVITQIGQTLDASHSVSVRTIALVVIAVLIRDRLRAVSR